MMSDPSANRGAAIALAIGGLLALLFGGGLLIAPEAFNAPLGVAMTPVIDTIAQAHGATLIGLGALNLLVSRAAPSGQRAALLGNLVVQAASLGVALKIVSLVGAAAAPAIFIHGALIALFGSFAWRLRDG